MIIPPGTILPMPRPYGGNPPTITSVQNAEGGVDVTVQLVGEIGPLTQFLELIDVLDTATEKDRIDIMIDTPGGDVYTTQHIVERMTSCKAQVTTIASGLVASAGTMIWFFGKNKRVDRWAQFMFHCSLHGDWGKSLQIQENSENLVNFMKNLLMLMLEQGVIDGREYDAMIKDKADVTLSGSEMRKRLATVLSAKAGGTEDDPEKGGSGEGEGGTNPNPEAKKPKGNTDGGDGGQGGGENQPPPEEGEAFDPDACYKAVLGEDYEPTETPEPATEPKKKEGDDPEKKEGDGNGDNDDDDDGDDETCTGGEDCKCKKCKAKRAKKNKK